MPKYKSKLRDKMKVREERGEDGRSLGVGDRTVESHYGKTPKPQAAKRKSPFTASIRSRIQQAVKSNAKKAVSSGLNKAKAKAKTASAGLTGIRHPAQLIPAIQKGRTLAGLIKAISKKV